MAASAKPSFFLRRPILSSVLSIIITLAGTISMQVLPIAQYPDLVPPTVNVSTSYPGASAETISETVLAPLEVQVNGVEHMLYMTSTASSGAGTGNLTVYFSLGTNPDMALVNVCNKVNLAQTLLPDTVRSLGVTVVKRSPAFLQFFTLYSVDERFTDVYLHNYLQINIVDELKRIEGVGDAQIFGYASYSMRIWVQPDKMAKYGVTIGDIANAVREQNSQFAPGRLGNTPSPSDTMLTWQIDTQGRLPEVRDFENIILKTGSDSARLHLKDVARVELGGQDYAVSASYNGHLARSGGVWLLPGANAIATGARVTTRLKELEQDFPEGLKLEVVVDSNDYVNESIKEVVHTLIEAMVLVFLVVFLFLQNWRATLIPCIAVPVSIIGTFAGMLALGYSINTLTLFGLVLAIGIVVDDAIVVLENVERIQSTEHLPAKEATAKAMSEVTSALIAIVLVLCSVFIPVSFMGGLSGQMYKQFAITISISVVLSGIVALTLTPALCSLLLQNTSSEASNTPVFFVKFNSLFNRLTHGYVATARVVKNAPLVSFILFLGVGAAVLCLNRLIPTSLVPSEDQGYALGTIILDDGASSHRVTTVANKVIDFAMHDKTIQGVMLINGYDILSSSVKSNYATIFYSFTPWSKRKEKGTEDFSFIKRVGMMNVTQPSAVVLSFLPPPIWE